MPRLADLCRNIRSKNAGPFHVTIDLFFRDRATFDRYAGDATLGATALSGILDVPADQIGCYPVADLAVLKISYPRRYPQGGVTERDLHGGQQYVRIIDLEVGGGRGASPA